MKKHRTVFVPGSFKVLVPDTRTMTTGSAGGQQKNGDNRNHCFHYVHPVALAHQCKAFMRLLVGGEAFRRILALPSSRWRLPGSAFNHRRPGKHSDNLILLIVQCRHKVNDTHAGLGAAAV